MNRAERRRLSADAPEAEMTECCVRRHVNATFHVEQ